VQAAAACNGGGQDATSAVLTRATPPGVAA
jgi:hypothetical protein